jgi:hypothetical protein
MVCVLAVAALATAPGAAAAGDDGLVDPYQDELHGLVDPDDLPLDPYEDRMRSRRVGTASESGLVDPYQDEERGLVDPDQDRIDPYLEALLPTVSSRPVRPRGF